MNVHPFRGRTLELAHRAARAALGEDAVVVVSRRVPRAGLAGILGLSEFEVVATEQTAEPASAPEPPSPTPVRLPFAADAYRSEGTEKRRDPASGRLGEAAAIRAELRNEIRAMKAQLARPNEEDALRAERDALRDEITQLRDAIEQLAPAPKKADAVTTTMRARGIEGTSAAALARTLKKAGDPGASFEDRVRDALAEVVSVAPWPLADEGKTIVTLVGPSGVGKTTTAAKMAARAIEAGRTVAFVGCDSFRVGAFDQLRRFAELLGVPCDWADGAARLEQVLSESTADLILVDTSGRPPQPSSPESLVAPQRFRSSPACRGRSRHVLLCVPASLRASDAAKVVRAFAAVKPSAICVTKLDETDAPAGLLHGPAAARVPVSILCSGPRVPEDLAPATAGALVDYLAPRGQTKEGRL